MTKVEAAIDRVLVDRGMRGPAARDTRNQILDAIEAAGFKIYKPLPAPQQQPEPAPRIVHRQYGGALGRTLAALDDKRADKVTEGVPLNPIEESEADD